MKLLGWAPEFHYDTGKWPGLVIVSVGAAVWEWFAYNKSADEATKLFPLDKALLLANAQVAAAYMILGGVLGFAFHLHLIWALIVSAGVLVIAVLLAPWWLRQKIIWQKAALPYLFRLADVLPTVDKPDADTLHNLIQTWRSARHRPMPDCDRRADWSRANLDGRRYRDRVRVQKSQSPLSQPGCAA
jgi:hypothetical protein